MFKILLKSIFVCIRLGDSITGQLCVFNRHFNSFSELNY